MVQGPAFTDLQSQQSRLVALNTGGLVAGKTGAVNTAVLLWFGPATLVGNPDYFEQVDDADDGTFLRITAPGNYELELRYLAVASANVLTVGLSKDQDGAAPIVAVPSFATPGIIDTMPTTLPAATAATLPQKLVTPFEVTEEEARQVVGGITGCVIRMLAAIGGPAAPGAALAQTAYYRLRRMGAAYSGEPTL